jgi:hypothetical protein
MNDRLGFQQRWNGRENQLRRLASHVRVAAIGAAEQIHQEYRVGICVGAQHEPQRCAGFGFDVRQCGCDQTGDLRPLSKLCLE